VTWKPLVNDCGTGAGGFKAGNHCARGGAGVATGEMLSKISKPDGGFTYSPVTKRSPSTGFALSPYPERSFAVSAKELKPGHLVDFVIKNHDLLSRPDHYVGGWHDPASGKVFLDISIMARDEKTARKLCLEKDQIAYFDLSKGVSVTVNPKATSGGVTNWRAFNAYRSVRKSPAGLDPGSTLPGGD
jgi:hypothetical protein